MVKGDSFALYGSGTSFEKTISVGSDETVHLRRCRVGADVQVQWDDGSGYVSVYDSSNSNTHKDDLNLMLNGSGTLRLINTDSYDRWGMVTGMII